MNDDRFLIKEFKISYKELNNLAYYLKRIKKQAEACDEMLKKVLKHGINNSK